MQRPWGALRGLYPRIEVESWDFLGAASFEDRCIAAPTENYLNIKKLLLTRFDDSDSRFRAVVDEKTNANIQSMREVLGHDLPVKRYGLLDPIGSQVADLRNFYEDCDNIIIDMTCMPKKYLVLALKEALKKASIKNILVTYTIPERYTSESLAEDLDPLKSFPGFAKDDFIEDEPSQIIVGLGYIPFDLKGLEQELSGKPVVHVLFPFPPGPPSFQRNWKLMLSLFEGGEEIPEPIRIDAKDASYAFDVIRDLTNEGNNRAYLLPFGPKPHSLAMALFSYRYEAELLYTQPKVYHPEYSSGIKKIGSNNEIYGYVIRLDGEDMY